MKYNIAFFTILILFLTPAQSYAGGLTVPSNLKLNHVECGTLPKAYAYFIWDRVDSATSYRFYTRTAGEAYTTFDEIVTPNYKLGFNPDTELRVSVSSINTFTGTTPTSKVLESDKSSEVTLSAHELLQNCKSEAATPTPTIAATPSATMILTPSSTVMPKAKPTHITDDQPTKVLRKQDIEMSEYASSPSAVAARPTTEEMFGTLFMWIKARLSFFH